MKVTSGIPIRILIADDHVVFRSALRVQLEKENDLKVVAEAGDGRETLQAVEDNEVDVVLLDLSMPGLSGSKVAERLMLKHPHLTIVVLTMHEDETYVRELMKTGARAFVLKKSVGADLLQAIRAAHRGERYVDPSLGGSVISSLSGRPDGSKGGGLVTLTAYEREICCLLAHSHTNAEIATQLSVSERKVERTRSSIMSKLGFKSRVELVRFAIENGLLRLD